MVSSLLLAIFVKLRIFANSCMILWCVCVPLCHPFSTHVAKPTQMGTFVLTINWARSKKQGKLSLDSIYVHFTIFLLISYCTTIIISVILFLSLIFLVTSFPLPVFFKMLFIVFPFFTLFLFIRDIGLIHFMSKYSRTPCLIVWSMIVAIHSQVCGFSFQVLTSC